MKYWLIPSKNEYFRLDDYFLDHDEVDWRQHNNFDVGDIVFIYSAAPFSRVKYLTQVVMVDIPSDKIINDDEYWGDDHPDEWNRYCRLKLIATAPPFSNALSYKSLVDQGLKSTMQGAITLQGELLDYILNNFHVVKTSETESVPEYIEGDSVLSEQISYERNSAAREVCIRYYGGYSCQICGTNFEDKYGEVGKEFIHVHHIHFLADNKGKATKTNPTKDLIPVCPNCHAMLHRKINGQYLTIEQLKNIVINK
jgi:5-methylcytosine-specific restriction protein A